MSVDLEKMSAAEILHLQSQLSERLAEKVEAEKLKLVSDLRDFIMQSGYDMPEIVDMLQEAVSDEAAKYRHPTDDSLIWSGRGRIPRWLHELIDQGYEKEDFRLNKS